METVNFATTLSRFQSSPLWGWYFDVPNVIATEFTQGTDRRVICTINGQLTIHCALMPNKGTWFVLLNKENVKRSIFLSTTRSKSACPKILPIMVCLCPMS
ncbi:MAG: DUF1905 domain-containing protein [Saprospiraceae bacterium]|nr:DUF1905 domain-containing protein [Saprospiraceae bacterium]